MTIATATPTTAASKYTLHDNDLLFGEDTSRYVLRVRDLPNDQKPREKLLKYGSRHLTVAELLAVALGVGTRKEEVNAMSHRILREYGEKAILHETKPQRLAEALDIPIGKASQVLVSFELGRRFYQQQAGRPVFVRNARQAYQHLKGIGESQKEQLTGLYLNSRYQVIKQEVISVGSVTANIVHPREVFLPAVESGAVAVIIAHNHPSGNSTPTMADLDVTEQLIGAGKLLGIELLDHLIITNRSYISLVQEDQREQL